jgi:hypothetical protein
MKKAAWIPIIILMAFSAGCLVYVPADESDRYPGPTDEETYYRGGERDISVFYDDLAPYGSWVDYPRYGYVWVPSHMPYGWRPYTHGRWIWSDYGWTWVSSYEWGWIPFHYGRWGFERSLGWFWVPDTVWGPAWVAWRTGDPYLGWAPLPPGAEFVLGVGLRSSGFDIPPYYWIFVDGRHFWEDRLDRYCLPYERNMTIINFTVVNINIRSRGDRVYNEGFNPDEAWRLTRQPITKYRLRDPGRPGSARLEGNEVLIHKPTLSRNQLARPKTVLRADEARENLAREGVDDSSIGEILVRERKLLKESQDEEITVIRRKVDEDRKRARTSDDKIKIERELETKVSELRKKHAEEKADLEKRQKQDEVKVKKGTLKKKD